MNQDEPRHVSDTDQVRDQLADAGARLAAADQARAAALDDIAAAMKTGKAADVPIATMAGLAGVSRLTAYRLLDRE